MKETCRVRPEFSDDWTECCFEGEDAAEVMNVLLSRLDSLNYETLVFDAEEDEFISPFEESDDAA